MDICEILLASSIAAHAHFKTSTAHPYTQMQKHKAKSPITITASQQLTCNSDSGHILCADASKALLQLSLADSTDEILLELLQSFSNAKNDAHALLNKLDALRVDVFISLLVDGAALGMAGEGPLDTDRLEHGRTDSSREGTSHFWRYHLGANLELVADRLLDRLNEREGNEQSNVAGRTWRDGVGNASGKLERPRLGLRIQLPISGNEGLSFKKLRRRCCCCRS